MGCWIINTLIGYHENVHDRNNEDYLLPIAYYCCGHMREILHKELCENLISWIVVDYEDQK